MASTQQQPFPPQQPRPQQGSETSSVAAEKKDLTSWWKTFKRGNRKEEAAAPQQPTGIFGVPLHVSIKYANVAISLYDDNGKSFIYGYVPIVVAKCGVFLKEKATETEGIFRLAGAERRIKELQAAFSTPDRYGRGLDWTTYTVHDGANVLRRYLNTLPEPIVPLGFYNKFRQPIRHHQAAAVGKYDHQDEDQGTFDRDGAIKTFQSLITELPPLNRQLLLYLLDLLAVFASKAEVNLMTAYNLSAVFQPSILSHPDHAMSPREYRLNQDVMIFLIENQDHFLVGMQGTAADEKTIQEVQNGPPKAPATPPVGKNISAGLARSSSTASAGAESIKKFGGVRRNQSVSSRRSRQSGHTPSPVTPPAEGAYNASAKSGGVHRSNTVPSKKSPSVSQNTRFNREKSPDPRFSSPLAQRDSPSDPRNNSTSSNTKDGVPYERMSPHLRPVLTVNKRTHSKDRQLVSPTSRTASPSGTPSKDRSFSNMFRQSPGEGEKKDGRKPNKLQKKRPDANLNPQNSNPSLSGASHPPSPGQHAPVIPELFRTESGTDARLDSGFGAEPQYLSLNNDTVEPTKETQMTDTEPPVIKNESEEAPTAQSLNTPLKDTSQRESGVTLKPAKSPAASIGSRSENNGYVSHDTAGEEEGGSFEEKEKKHRRWKFSRSEKRVKSPSKGSGNLIASSLGSAAGAERSTSSVGSFSKPRKSFTDDSNKSSVIDPAGSEAEGSGSPEGGKKGPIGWFKGKLQDRKERAKSPPPGAQPTLTEEEPSGMPGAFDGADDLTPKAEKSAPALAVPEEPTIPNNTMTNTTTETEMK